MAEEKHELRVSDDNEILEQQFRRAVSSFEGIILSQIDMKNKLSERLNYSIQAGLAILSFIAISILILLLTLSAQINKISYVVEDMNVHFTTVSNQMGAIQTYVDTMEQRVALLESISGHTDLMIGEMEGIVHDMETMQVAVNGIAANVNGVRNNVGNISMTIDRMDLAVGTMAYDMHNMSQPSRTMNDMFPFP